MSLAILVLIAASSSKPSDDEISMQALVVATISSIILTHFVLKFDERRLSPEQLARAWLPASRLFAYAMAPYSLLVHFLRTRVARFPRTLAELLKTMAWFAFGVLVVVCVLVLVEIVAQATEWLVHTT